jgi:transcriptional regulator with XRE-family HTH domain
MSFGQRLKELRNREGLTLRELASRVGSNYAYLSQIEAGLGKPSEELARKLARLFQVDEEEFVFLARDIPSQIEEIKNKFPKMAPHYFRKVLEGENKK